MTGFETFDIKAWLVDGFTKHIHREAVQYSKSKRQHAPKWVIGISLLAAMASVNSITVSSASVGQTKFIWPQQSTGEPNDWIEHPSRYWPALIREISTWQPVKEYGTEDPPDIL
jgi:hypothetical protein